jgi:hypothetical protein
MSNAAFISTAGFCDGGDTPKTYSDVMKHKEQPGRWISKKGNFMQ